jgi:16S rRNA (cytosine967-C5)-methyltransferase
VTGVLRWQGALDAVIDSLLVRRTRLDDAVRVVLRLGAYQRLFLTRIPAAAAVNDAVALVRHAGVASASGLVNAVLRRVDPAAARAAWPPAPSPDDIEVLDRSAQTGAAADPVFLPAARTRALDFLEVTRSHPRWLVERWLDRHGFAAVDRWTAFDNEAAPLTLRPGAPLEREDLIERLAAHGVRLTPGRWAPLALRVIEGQPLQTPLAGEGLFAMQDEASQLVAQLCVDLRPSRVLDLCASPGGKTTYIQAARGGRGVAVACDLRPRRLDLLRTMLLRARTRGVHVVRVDAANPLPFRAVFDLVLLDAPCSGLGTIRREPELRWRRQARDLAVLGATQRDMVHHAASAVSPGGYLVYATCSSEPEENETVVDAFLESRPVFRRLAPGQHPWYGGSLAALLDDRGDFRTLPHRHGLEAFYAAVLVRP